MIITNQMPITVSQLFNLSRLPIHGQAKWGQLINSRTCGFYVIALSDDKDKVVCLNELPFNDIALKQWIKFIKLGGKNILIDNEPADTISIKQRLEKFWFPDETILYIGKAGPNKRRTIRRRVKEFYETKMGCNKKHAGGHWLRLLSNITTLNIYFSEFSGRDIDEQEQKLILSFMSNISNETKKILHDPVNCYPFANKELYYKDLGTKIRKAHGLRNQTIDCGAMKLFEEYE